MPDPRPNDWDAERLIYGGVLGLAVAGSLQLIDKAKDDSLPLTVAGCAFAASLPLLAASLLSELVRHRQPRPAPPAVWRQMLGLLATLTAVAGLAALFFHFGTLQGSLFVGSIAVGVLVVRSL